MAINGFYYFIAIVAVVYLYSPIERQKQKVPYLCICAMLMICSCLRHVEVGIDTPSYVEYFLIFRDLPLSESLKWNFEPGYIELNKLIGVISSNPQIFLAVLSIIVLSPIFWITWQKSPDPLLSVLVFVVVQNWYSTFAALRQWCAVAVMVIGFKYIVERKLIRFVCVTLLACAFHQTALFVLPMYVLYSFRITRQRIILCMAVAMFLFLFSDQVMGILYNFARYEYGKKTGGGLILLIVLWMLVALIDLFAAPIENEKNMKVAFIALIYSAVIQPLCLQYGELARIHSYCWYGMGFGISGVIQFMCRKYTMQEAFLMKFIVVIILILWYVMAFNGRVFMFMWQ